MNVEAIVAACDELVGEIVATPELAHTSHLLVRIGPEIVYDAHLRGPDVAPVFSVTKSVVATLVGVALEDGHLCSLEVRVGDILELPPGRARGQTLRHLLTMSRGTAPGVTDDVDAMRQLPSDWVGHAAAATQVHEPGTVFRYDDGGAHLLSAALTRLIGRPLDEYARERLFAPLGITDWSWERDPDGITIGPEGLALSAADLSAIGLLWNRHGMWQRRRVVDEAFARTMVGVQSAGGPPECQPYGYLVWIDQHGPFAGGWAGQHVTCVTDADTVIVTTGDPRFDPGPPPRDELPPGWRAARELVVPRLLPMLGPP